MSFNHSNGSEVQKVYTEQKNYIIEINPNITPAVTVVYFSSNGIYFPNTLECFSDTILKKNRFEWTNKHNQIAHATKSIFVRDVFKQWYIKGINSEINDLDKLIEFIKQESQGSKLICVGSSAGGYGATLVGSVLNAEAVFAFSGQFTLQPWMEKGNNDLLSENYGQWKHYYNLENQLQKTKANIFYFASAYSKMDKEDIEISLQYPSVHPFIFKTSVHGVPFKAFMLAKLFSTSIDKLILFSNRQRGATITPNTFGKYLYTFIAFQKAYANYAIRKVSKLPHHLLKKVNKGSLS